MPHRVALALLLSLALAPLAACESESGLVRLSTVMNYPRYQP